MIRLWTGVLLGATLMLSACIQPGTTLPIPESTSPLEAPVGATPQTGEAAEIGMIVRQVLLQQLGADAGDVTVVTVEPVDWPDACLGVSQPDVMCAQVITPGYRVVLEANGERYVYHTDAEGTNVVLAEAPEPQVGDVQLDWRQTGTTCESLQIGTDGLAFGPCMGTLMPGRYITPERQQEFDEFVATYAPFEVDTPAGAVTFAGEGDTQPTLSEQRMVAEWARLVHLEATSGRSGASWGLAFAWHREGGIAGFCDDLTVYVTGQVYASTCTTEPPTTLAQRRLAPDGLAQLYTWVDTFAPFEVDERDPAVADAMTVTLVFSGAGTQPATEEDRQAILAFASRLFGEMSQ